MKNGMKWDQIENSLELLLTTGTQIKGLDWHDLMKDRCGR